ncbi:MAG TPA: beta-ketoacyl-[acyl-carrier-protein] synthase family protein [Burkholderiales bacterium]|nr:beta-ketoacyl-[acyl-carrier-protein] synthase family protein [Burkholderiales bacterium]
MTPRRRVVVTGMGCVTALGVGAPLVWAKARDGESGVSPFSLDRFEHQQVKAAAHFSSFAPHALLEKNLAADTDRFAQFALVAAAEALDQARSTAPLHLNERTGVIVGSGIGGASTSDDQHYTFYVTKARNDPFTIPRVMPNAAASHISMRYGAKGPCFAVSSACSSASQSIGLGLQAIRSGMIDTCIVGGSEALLTPATFRAWESLRVLTSTLCRPFSKGRNGMVLGEGAGILVIEAEETARRRGAAPLAELAGYGTCSDAGDIVRPDRDGAARCMQLALDDAGLVPQEIDYVNAHGTGTILNDACETAALSHVFGSALEDLSVSSTKPIHGHTLGAAGGIELVITVSAVREQIAPPTINWLERDTTCIADPVANVARPRRIRAALSNSFAFGGINACLAVTPYS